MKYADQIEEVMSEFDFDSVHKAMVALHWCWADEGVPSVARIQERARDLLSRLADLPTEDGDSYIRTGGLCASRRRGWLALAFQVSRATPDGAFWGERSEEAA